MMPISPEGWREAYPGGRRWRMTADGIEVEGVDGLPRTAGEPLSIIGVMEDFGSHFVEAAPHAGVGVDTLAALCCKEAARIDGSYLRDPRSLRLEPGYVSDKDTPHKVSPGLMQTLIEEAQNTCHLVGIRRSIIDRNFLFNPRNSILCAAGSLRNDYGPRRKNAGHFGDPVLAQAAYNAGGVYESSKNPWLLRTYGLTRTDEFIAYFNDFHAALRDGAFGVPYARLLSTETPT